MEQNSAVFARPDVNGLPPINKRVPLSQQNKHQPNALPNSGEDTVITRTSLQNQNILQSQVFSPMNLERKPLAQMNSHQKVTHVTARPDVNSERQTIVNSSVDRQPTIVVPQPKQQPQVNTPVMTYIMTSHPKPLSQMNSHQNVTQVTARPDVNTERQTIDNLGFEHQPINVAPQKNKKHKEVVVPTPQTYNSSPSRSNVVIPTVYNAPYIDSSSKIRYRAPQDNTTLVIYPERTTSNYPVKRIHSTPTSFFASLLTVFVIVALAIVILAVSDKRRR